MRMPDSWDSQGKAAEGIRGPIGPQKDERKATQKRTFTRWINIFLQRHEASLEVGDLFDDIQDGKVLMVLLEELTGCKLFYRFRTPSHRIFKLNNISKALAFLDDRHVKLLGIDASSVADGVPSVVLSLIWNIILHFQVKKVTGRLQRRLSSSLSSLSSENDLQPSPDDGGCYSCNSLPRKSRKPEREPKYHGKTIRTLLQWVQKCTSKYGVDVHDFGRSWRSGLAFLALIKSINPDLVDLRESLSKPPEENLQQAFTVAHRSLDVPPLLEPEDVTADWPDEQSIITYVSMFLGLWSDMDENQTPDTDVFEIPSFGSVQSKETIAEASKAQAQLQSFERSSELQLWKRWSRKSSGTSPASASCISPLRALKLPSPLNAKAGDQEVHMWVSKGLDWRDESQRGHESPVSFGSEDGSLSSLDSDEEDAYSYILDLNEEAFQPYKVLKKQVSKVEEETVEEMREELKHMEAGTVNGFQPNQNLDFHSEFEVWGHLGLQRNFELNKNQKSFTESKDEAMLSVVNKNTEETAVEDREGDYHDGEKQKEVKTSTMDARSTKSKDKSSERLDAAGRSSGDGFKEEAEEEEAPLLMDSPPAMRRSTELEIRGFNDLITAMVQSGESPLEKHHGDPCDGKTRSTSGFDAASPTLSREDRRSPHSLAASCGLTPLELEMLLLLWILLYCFFLLPHMNP
ncbi:spectrin beta chain, erythrocytic isoform X1 [Oryzias latipes]|uniref:Calponin-homology (CH) domain-containing protein n=1 Tax=Oryzias latipes TaxID=8090 RepID=H2MMG2_ORYLA|nr:spectrin beta chain, erythrocytic isoform X1 [Oryzias latipes]